MPENADPGTNSSDIGMSTPGACQDHILIILVAGIGDLVLASRSIRAVRNAHPSARIHLLTNADAVQIARQYPFVDTVWPFPIRTLRTNRLRAVVDMLATVRALRAYRFRSIVNLYPAATVGGAVRMGILLRSLRTQLRVGVDMNGLGRFVDCRVPGDVFVNRHFCDGIFEAARPAGVQDDGRGIEVFWDPASEGAWRHLFVDPDGNRRGPVIGINPGCDRPYRRWFPDRFAAVADQLEKQYNATVLILGGPGEIAMGKAVAGSMHGGSRLLAGELTLSDLVYVISNLDLFITNDSGPMHIAAARGTPQVALFGHGDPLAFGPYTAPENYVVIHKDIGCASCDHDACAHLSCLTAICVEEVISAGRTLLDRPH